MQILSSILLVAALALGIADAAHPLSARHPGASKSSTPSCSSSQFLYEERNCCLEKGGPSKTPIPPKGVGCPNEWYFHNEQNCCVPKNPLPKPPTNKPKPTPSCPQKGYLWSLGLQCCTPPATTTHHTTSTHHPSPTPTQKSKPYGKEKRSYVDQWDASSCPSGLDSCPYEVNGLTQGYECVDATSDVKNCGGCAVGGFGTDCTKIANVDVSSVSCSQSLCVVQKCAAGFVPSGDDSSCVKA